MANRCILWRLKKSRKTFWFCHLLFIYSCFVIYSSFHQLKGMQNSKLGRVCERGTICQQKVYERSTFSSKNSI